ncbi:MAG: hydroxymethylbilane synthase [Pseudomonadales bacterium]|nr:MAG: hydroxymethylbilane synthase [Pseudomonadales bacterium]
MTVMQNPASRLTIATRESPLALWQARHVAARLEQLQPGLSVALLGITTQGDKMLSGPLFASGGKGLFVKELEHALLDGRADLAVHSAKDMPADLPEGLELMVVGPRAEVCDALVLPQGHAAGLAAGIQSLADGAVVGTASQRRLCQLRHARPDLDCRPLRGNVNTRLGKLDSGEFDAIVLAAAGLQRLGFDARISALLPVDTLLPAAGQGALAVEYRANDNALRDSLAGLCDPATTVRVAAERAFSARLEGGCQLPIGALARLGEAGELELQGLVGAVDGERLLTDKAFVKLDMPNNNVVPSGALQAATAVGRMLAERMLASGADQLLREQRAAP